jgi:hypothetical protein
MLIPSNVLSSRATLLLLHLLCTCQAQSMAFSRQEECSQDASLVGYTTLEAINADMADELARIQGGGDPAIEYTLILCPPSGTLLDPRRGNELKPVLNNVNIVCAETAECVLEQSQIQVLVENSQVANYPLESVSLRRLTFQDFRGTAISFRANIPTEFTCEDCVFRNFSNSRFVIEILSPTLTGDPAGTTRINNGVIEVCKTKQLSELCPVTTLFSFSFPLVNQSTGSTQSTTSFAFFDNAGGFLRVNNLKITNTNPQGPIFLNRNGDTIVSDLIIQDNVIDAVSRHCDTIICI